MSRAVLDGWGAHEFPPGLYPERLDARPNRMDNVISGVLGRLACSASVPRLLPLQIGRAHV